ncbi:hypothetical protein [Lysinibacillus xylanilyticus]|uniref:hypothetical protein n=1 Tax=Lysinibacillus xylanilyticus TaxID=582475 RepID=UPI003CFC61CA
MNTKSPWYKKKKVWKWIGIVFLALFIIGKVSEITGYSDKLEAQKAEEKAAAQAEKDAERKKLDAEIAAKESKAKKKQEAEAKAKAEKEKAEKERLANRTIDEKIKDAVVDVVGKESYRKHKFEDNTLWIQVTTSGNFTQNMMLKGTYMDMLDIAEKVREESLLNGANDVDVSFYTELTDAYGKTSDGVIVEIGMNKATLEKIDFKNVLHKNVPTIADYYWEHPLFSKQ